LLAVLDTLSVEQLQRQEIQEFTSRR